MSENVEVNKRIVELQMKSDLFERNAKQAISTLDSLNKAMQFDESRAGFDAIQRSANGVDFSKLTDQISSITRLASPLGIGYVTIITDITRKLESLGKSLVHNLVSLPQKMINQIYTGGRTRAQNLDEAIFKIEGLGQVYDDVAEDIDYGVDKTRYGMDEAATAAAQLMASGVEFGKTFGEKGNSPMAHALRGISGVAAMTSSSYGEIAHIFTTVAGQGKVMTEQLRMLEGRGLNAAAKIAEYLGVTEEELREMVSDSEVSFEDFSEAMFKAFGVHAERANETFEGSLANMKASLSRIGQPFWESFRKDMVPVFNQLRLRFNEIKEILKDNGVFESVSHFLEVVLGNLSKIISLVPLDWLNNVAASFSSTVNKASDLVEGLTGKVLGFFGIVKPPVEDVKESVETVNETAEATMETLGNLEELAKRVIRGDFGNGEERMNALGDAFKPVQNKVNEMLGCTFRYAMSQEELDAATQMLNGSLEEQSGYVYDNNLNARMLFNTWVKLQRVMSKIGQDASMSTEEFNRMDNALDNIGHQGLLLTDDLKTLEDSGVPAAQYLAEALGTDVDAINELAKNGSLSVETFADVLEGRFGSTADIIYKDHDSFYSSIEAASLALENLMWHAGLEDDQFVLLAATLDKVRERGYTTREDLDKLADAGVDAYSMLHEYYDGISGQDIDRAIDEHSLAFEDLTRCLYFITQYQNGLGVANEKVLTYSEATKTVLEGIRKETENGLSLDNYSRIEEVFSNIHENGNLLPEQLSELESLGVPAVEALCKAFNQTEEGVYDLAKNGEIHCTEFVRALYPLVGKGHEIDEGVIDPVDDLSAAFYAMSLDAKKSGVALKTLNAVFDSVHNTGYLTADALAQLDSVGLNASENLARGFGVTEEEFKNMVSTGQVSVDMFTEAVNSVYSQPQTASEHMDSFLLKIQSAFETIKSIGSVLIGAVKEPITNFANDVLNGFGTLGDSFGGIFDNLFSFIHNEEQLASVQQSLSTIFSSFFGIITSVGSVARGILSTIFDKISEWAANVDVPAGLNTIAGVFESLSETVGNVATFFLNTVIGLGGPIGELADGIWTSISDGISTIGGMISEFFGFTKDEKKLAKVQEGITGTFTDFVDLLKSAGGGVKKILSNIFGFFNKDDTKIDGEKVFTSITDAARGLIKSIKELGSKVYTFLQTAMIPLQGVGTAISTIFKSIWGVITKLIDKFKEFAKNTKETNEEQEETVSLGERIKTVFEWIGETVGKVISGIGDAIGWLIDRFFEAKSNFEEFYEQFKQTEGYQVLLDIFEKVKAKVTEVKDSVIGFFEEYIGDKLSMPDFDATNFAESVSNKILWLEEKATALKTQFESMFSADIAENAKGIFESITNFFKDFSLQKVFDALGSFLSIFTGQTVSAATLDESGEALTDGADAAGEIASQLGIVSEQGSGLSGIFSQFKATLDSLVSTFNSEGFNGVISKIKELLGTIATQDTVNTIFNVLKGITMLTSLAKVNKVLTTLNSGLKSIKSLIGQVSNAVKTVTKELPKTIKNFNKVLKSYARNQTATALLKTAAALGVLALAFAGLSFLSWDQIKKGSAAIIVLAGAVSLLILALGSIKKKKSGASDNPITALADVLDYLKGAIKKFLGKVGLASLIISVGIAVGKIVDAIITLGDMDETKVLKGFLAVSAILIELMAVVGLMSLFLGGGGNAKGKGKGKDVKGGKTIPLSAAAVIIAIMLAVKSMANTAKTLGEIDKTVLFKGIAAVGVLTLLLDSVLYCMKFTKKAKGFSTAGVIIAVVLGVLGLAYSVKTLGDYAVENETGFLKGIGAIAILIGLIDSILYCSQFTKKAKLLPMVAIAAIILEITLSLCALAGLDTKKLDSAGTAFLKVGGVVAVLALIFGFLYGKNSMEDTNGTSVPAKIGKLLLNSVPLIEIIGGIILILNAIKDVLVELADGTYNAANIDAAGNALLKAGAAVGIIAMVLGFILGINNLTGPGIETRADIVPNLILTAENAVLIAEIAAVAVIMLQKVSEILTELAKNDFTEEQLETSSDALYNCAVAISVISAVFACILGINNLTMPGKSPVTVLAQGINSAGQVATIAGATVLAVKGLFSVLTEVAESGVDMDRLIKVSDIMIKVAAVFAIIALVLKFISGKGPFTFANGQTYGIEDMSILQELKGSAKQVASIAIGGVKIGLIFTIIAGLIEAIGWIQGLVPDTEWDQTVLGLERIGIFFEKIGSALGKFAGGIVGGVIGGAISEASGSIENLIGTLTDELPNLGTSMQTFISSVTSAFSDDGSNGGFSVTALDSVVSIFGRIIEIGDLNQDANFKAMMYSDGGSQCALEVLGDNLIAFAGKMSSYSEEISKMKVLTVTKTSWAIGSVLEYSKDAINTSTSLLSYIDSDGNGDSKLVKLGDELVKFAGKMVDYGDKIVDLKTDAVDSSDAAVKMILSYAQEAPTVKYDGSLAAWLSGSNELGKLGQQLLTFGGWIVLYSWAITGLNVSAIDASDAAVHMLLGYAQEAPSSTSLFSKVFGGDKSKSLGSIGQQLKTFGGGIRSYAMYVKGLDDDAIKKSATAVGVIFTFAEMAPKVVDENSFWLARLGGENGLTNLGNNLGAFGKGIKDFTTEVSSDTNLDTVVEAFTKAKEFITSIVDATSENQRLIDSAALLEGMADDVSAIFDAFAETVEGYGENKGLRPDDIIQAARNLGIRIAGWIVDGVGNGLTSKTWEGDSINTLGNKIHDALVSAESMNSVNLAGTSIGNQLCKVIKAALSPDSESGGNRVIKGVKKLLDAARYTMINILSLRKIEEATNTLLITVETAIDNHHSVVIERMIALIEAMATPLNDPVRLDNWYTSGKNITIGIGNGIADEEANLTTVQQVVDLCERLLTAAKQVLNEHSPSKEFEEIGENIPLGAAKGIQNKAKVAVWSVEDMAKTIISTMENAMGTSVDNSVIQTIYKELTSVYDQINAILNDPNYSQPTITPVMDLTQLQRDTNTVSNMMNNLTNSRDTLVQGYVTYKDLGGAIDAASNRDLISTVINTNVIGALEGIRKDITGLGSEMAKMKVVMDNNALVGQIGSNIDQYLGNVYLLNERGAY